MTTSTAQNVIPADYFIEHWQGHRRLTRQVIEAFPEDKLFTFSIGGMRPFSDLIIEILDMARYGIQGVYSREWMSYEEISKLTAAAPPKTKAEFLKQWDETTTLINTLAPKIPIERYAETDKAFGMWEGTMYWIMLYWIDNEIHHRGQAYVYLRSLGITPPGFYDRS